MVTIFFPYESTGANQKPGFKQFENLPKSKTLMGISMTIVVLLFRLPSSINSLISSSVFGIFFSTFSSYRANYSNGPVVWAVKTDVTLVGFIAFPNRLSFLTFFLTLFEFAPPANFAIFKLTGTATALKYFFITTWFTSFCIFSLYSS